MVSIGKYLLYGLIGAFAISALVDPQRAYATTQAFRGVGTSLGALGGGIQSLLTGVGTGTAKLFNPLFTLRDLIYGPQAGQQTEKDVQEISSTGQITSDTQQIRDITTLQIKTPTQIASGFRFSNVPSISPVPTAPGVVHGQTLPLSADAVSFYQKAGVTVSPASIGTVGANNPANAISPLAAAHARGYSTGQAYAAGQFGGIRVTR